MGDVSTAYVCCARATDNGRGRTVTHPGAIGALSTNGHSYERNGSGGTASPNRGNRVHGRLFLDDAAPAVTPRISRFTRLMTVADYAPMRRVLPDELSASSGVDAMLFGVAHVVPLAT